MIYEKKSNDVVSNNNEANTVIIYPSTTISMATNNNDKREIKLQSKVKFPLEFVDSLFLSIKNTKDSDTTDLGNISDGYHTFNELYKHRHILFAALCNAYPNLSWKSRKHYEPDQPMYDGMFIAGILTPQGQATYHVENEYWELFANVPELKRGMPWDGHTPDDAIERIAELISK